MAGPLCGPFSFVGIIRAMPFDFAAITSPFRMQPGLRRIAPGAQQLTPSSLDSIALREKLEVLTRRAEEALVADPAFDARPALQALCVHAAGEHPAAFGEAAGAWHAHALGWSLHGDEPRGDGPREIGTCLRALPAHWRLPGLLALVFEQDFAVLDASTGRIPWLAVCLPSHWSPQDKVGRLFAEVHAPVADNATLLAASDALARLVTGTDRWERFVWTISANPRLQQHPMHSPRNTWPTDTTPDALAAQAFLRTEHQTFLPLADRRQAVFTIHVESRPLTEAAASAEHARQLHDALATMSAAVLGYRGLTDAQPRLLTWLAQRAQQSQRSGEAPGGE